MRIIQLCQNKYVLKRFKNFQVLNKSFNSFHFSRVSSNLLSLFCELTVAQSSYQLICQILLRISFSSFLPLAASFDLDLNLLRQQGDLETVCFFQSSSSDSPFCSCKLCTRSSVHINQPLEVHLHQHLAWCLSQDSRSQLAAYVAMDVQPDNQRLSQ